MFWVGFPSRAKFYWVYVSGFFLVTVTESGFVASFFLGVGKNRRIRLLLSKNPTRSFSYQVGRLSFERRFVSA